MSEQLLSMNDTTFFEEMVPARCAECIDFVARPAIEYVDKQRQDGELTHQEAFELAKDSLSRCKRANRCSDELSRPDIAHRV